MDDNKKKALDAALSQIERQYGKGSVMKLGDPSVMKDIEAVSTGSLGLDIALGIGGLPKGRGRALSLLQLRGLHADPLKGGTLQLK